ncbi:hypothetical protein [Agromyces allii]|uniref:EcsC family protein n=1 Tax=Agromyces allii TaxID=393607 RepID=A0ABP5BI29_9MICO|nr:hypothetical protein [Agromyces allii]
MTDATVIDDAPAKQGLTLALLDKALTFQAPMTDRHIARIRVNRPDATPEQVVKRLNVELRAATIAGGVGVGAAAAAPAVGTGVALAISGGEAIAFLNATVLYILARAEVQGIRVDDIERRRTLVMAILLGDLGAKSVTQVAERTGQHWARQLVSKIPMSQIKAANKVLGHNFITKYGTKQGIIVLGKVVPFGIGAVIGGAANALASQGVITASNLAFGDIRLSWDDSAEADTGPESKAPRAELSEEL